jgi:hypothetical protein
MTTVQATLSQKRIFAQAQEHFKGSATLNPEQFIKNTQKRLLSAGMTEAQAVAMVTAKSLMGEAK